MKYPPNDDAPSRSTDPWTSHLAGAQVPVNVLERMYLNALHMHASLTTTEIARFYGMDRDSFSPRSRPLIRKRLVIQEGHRVVPNKSGKPTKMLAFRLRRRDET